MAPVEPRDYPVITYSKPHVREENKMNEEDGLNEKPKTLLSIVESLLQEALSGISPRSKKTILNEALEIVKELQ